MNKYNLKSYDELTTYEGIDIIKILTTALIPMYQHLGNETDINKYFNDVCNDNSNENIFKLYLFYINIMNQEQIDFMCNLFSYKVLDSTIKLNSKSLKKEELKDIYIEFIRGSLDMVKKTNFFTL
jgi:hypothetical protein